jgi:putative transposase
LKLIAYKYRFYPNNEQAKMLAQTFGCVRFAYNSSLGFSKEQYDLGNKTNYNDWSKNFTQLKKNPDLLWLKSVSSVPLQQSLNHLDKGFKSFFKSGFGYPKFKSKHDHQSASYMSNGFKWDNDKQVLTLAKMKQPLKIKWSRTFTGKPSSLTVSRTKSGKYFVSMLVKEAVKQLPVINKTIGVDVGIKDLAICSDGVKFNNPRLTNRYAKKLVKASRKLAKRKKALTISKNKNVLLLKSTKR